MFGLDVDTRTGAISDSDMKHVGRQPRMTEEIALTCCNWVG